MPELPDLAVVAEAFHAALAGRSITRAEAPAPLAVRGTPGELQALVGQRLERVERRGKFILFDLERDRIAVNAMLTGRFQLAAPTTKRPASTRQPQNPSAITPGTVLNIGFTYSGSMKCIAARK